MKQGTLKPTANSLKHDVARLRTVRWRYERWRHWELDEIRQVAELAGVTYSCTGIGEDLVFYEYP